jgi:hypothetical protein
MKSVHVNESCDACACNEGSDRSCFLVHFEHGGKQDMADNETQKLRDQIASLQSQLGEAKQGNVRRGALRAAGIREDWIDDMLEIFDPQRAEDGTWAHAGMEKSSIEKLANRFVEQRPHLRPAAGASAAQTPSVPDVARYADGTLIPMGALGQDELSELAGRGPQKPKPVAKPQHKYSRDQLAGMTLDELADLAG